MIVKGQGVGRIFGSMNQNLTEVDTEVSATSCLLESDRYMRKELGRQEQGSWDRDSPNARKGNVN